MNKILAIVLINFLFIACVPKKESKESKSLIADFDKNIVQTAYGKVRGYKLGETFIFKGIPYAKAERFMPPAEPDSWEGVRNSMAYGYMCPQHVGRGDDESAFLHQHSVGYMDEDCMGLNIWTQGINDGKKRPVMLWFHGGGFTAGSGQDLPCYDGENISKKGDIVLINLNHRLNALGFMNLSDFGDKYKYSGNVGIMDLVAALKWINKNISQFGGDPDNVTVFGQSGGGGKVTALLGTPSAQGLFHKAIIHSGARTYFLEDKYSKMIGQGVLKELGLKPSQVDSLQKIPYEILIDASNKVIERLNDEIKNPDVPFYNSNLSWNPCVDGDFMPFHPTAKEVLTLNSDVPIIIGSNKNELEPFSQSVTGGPQTMEEAKKKLIHTFGDKTDEYIELVKKTYPNDSRPIDFVNIDTGYRTRTLALAAHRSKVNPVYMYFFQWNSPVIDGRFQSHHSLEIPFVFNNIDKCKEMTGGGEDAYKLANKMSQTWINFARSGNPNNEQLPLWPIYSEENGSCMVFDNDCEVRSHHDKELLEFINKRKQEIFFADPTIYVEDGKYYLTGTGGDRQGPSGFSILESNDLKIWTAPAGVKNSTYMILTRGDQTFGTKGFWAPQIFKADDTYYLTYTADEQTVLAQSKSLQGPYRQKKVTPIDGSVKNIDSFIFKDDDGKHYLYHVRLNKGNYLWVAEFNLEKGKIKQETLTKCFDQTEPWEATPNYESAPIMEGPTVIKLKNKYYLFYSANHFMNIDYAVGYAVSDSPYGPWIKQKDNPILHRSIVGENGSGHGDFFESLDGGLYYVYHVHFGQSQVSPRRTRIVPVIKEWDSEKSLYKFRVKGNEVIVPVLELM